MIRKGVTESFGAAVSCLNTSHLTDEVIRRSKRMILDTLGVGLLGTSTPVFNIVLRSSQRQQAVENSKVWARPGLSLPPQYAAFVNGVAVHSMDFDDTWHPATHPSGAVLPALLALAETLPAKPSGLELLLAFNVGLEVQGRLMRFSKEAHNIPKRFHPPAVVGIMGSAAASAKLLGLPAAQSIAALAIACSSAGAPMANAATQTKPLHMGNAARGGLEASQLALLGLEGNTQILDLASGFGAFYPDYVPQPLAEFTPTSQYKWVLEDQNIAQKRFPAHLGMHWVADAAIEARATFLDKYPNADLSQIKKITLRVPSSRYVDCPFPVSEHQARHSFQFNCCTALLDGQVTVDSFSKSQMNRSALKEMLLKVELENPQDNHSSFEKMYCEIAVETTQGEMFNARCNTFYGHWRKPLSHEDLVMKFRANASTVLTPDVVDAIIYTVDRLDTNQDCSMLWSYMHFNKHMMHRHEHLYSALA
ncbi:cis-aconitate decarboxylase [Pimephales promelas]|uniref:cis-aconitate decarboxylase n=1 Tax=Pimephales promelas TaxID=90988 RepID=UPI001955968E|nr:cis-aconitate decarboxylase [Pimephales promelas]KAG1928109.1 cis-aconitate decarboxylase [Pimephales promelas]